MNGTSLHVLPFHVTPNDPRSPLIVAPWLREPFLEVGGIEDNGALADWSGRGRPRGESGTPIQSPALLAFLP